MLPSPAADTANTMLDAASRCACMDPQRRKLLPYAFYQSVDGYTTLQCSGTLYVSRQQSGAQRDRESARDSDGSGSGVAQVICCADVLLPFVTDTSPLELLEDTSISILPSTTPPSAPNSSASPSTPRWWLCDLLRCDDVPGVQTAIDQLTHSSTEWAVGWQTHPQPASTSTTSSPSPTRSSPSHRSHSAATFAVLRVKQPLHPKHYRSTTLSLEKVLSSPTWSPSHTSSAALVPSSSSLHVSPVGFPSFPPLTFLSSRSLRRGSDVRVIASPYGLLSPAVFHNSVSGGIVSNVVYASSTGAVSGPSAAGRSEADVPDGTVTHASFPSSDVSFPRHLHFPTQAHPTSSSSSSTPSSSASLPSAIQPQQAVASVFLTDCRCLPGSEGGPVVLSTARTRPPTLASSSASTIVLAGVVTLPLHLTNALSPVLLNNVVGAEAVWHWLHEDERTAPHPHFHHLASPATAAVVNSLTSSPTVNSTFSTHSPPTSGLSTKAASSSAPLYAYPVSASTLTVGGMVERAERSLAIAKVESSWASAIVLTAEGYIATNAHLLAPFLTAPTATPATNACDEPTATSFAPLLSASVSVGLSSRSRRRWHQATVVYICRSPWDLALLKIDSPSPLTPVPLPLPSSQPARPGDTVYVLGHALFSPSSMLLPTVTRGVLSQLVSLLHAASSSPSHSSMHCPVLLQTDSAVHNGNSGGLLLSHTGLCLGMVTSNIQHTALPATPDQPNPPYSPSTSPQPATLPTLIIPQLNLSIPSAVLCRLRSHIQQHCSNGAEGVSDVLGGVDVWREWEAGESGLRSEVERMWGLSLVDVWEQDVKPRSSKYREVVERVQRMERDKLEQQQQLKVANVDHANEHVDRRARL